ncbi:MAG: hypothetical protein ABW192_03090, partial [Sphingobium sp.]
IAILAAMVLLVYVKLVPAISPDLVNYLFPWYDFIAAHGAWRSMGQFFANYTPPYLYLLAIGSLFDAALGKLAIIKLLSILGNMILAAAAYDLVRHVMDRNHSLIVALCVMLLPSVAVNGPLWGQCDALYTAAIVFAVSCALRQRWTLAMVAMGVGLALKLQVMFVAPACLVLLLRGKIRWWMLPIPVIVYYLMMVPALLAGRTLADVSLVYMGQFGFYHWLSGGAPNLWQLIGDTVGYPAYRTGLIVGLIAGAATGLWIALKGMKLRLDNPADLLLLFTASALLLPYVLPKMHDRYFFAGTVLALLHAIVRKSGPAMLIAVCAELGSLIASLSFLYGIGTPALAALFMTGAVLLSVLQLIDRARQQSVRPSSPA